MYCRPNIFEGVIELTPQGRCLSRHVVVGWWETGGVVYMLYQYDFHFSKSLVTSLRDLIWLLVSVSCMDDHMPGQINSETDDRLQHFTNTTAMKK